MTGDLKVEFAKSDHRYGVRAFVLEYLQCKNVRTKMGYRWSFSWLIERNGWESAGKTGITTDKSWEQCLKKGNWYVQTGSKRSGVSLNMF